MGTAEDRRKGVPRLVGHRLKQEGGTPAVLLTCKTSTGVRSLPPGQIVPSAWLIQGPVYRL